MSYLAKIIMYVLVMPCIFAVCHETAFYLFRNATSALVGKKYKNNCWFFLFHSTHKSRMDTG